MATASDCPGFDWMCSRNAVCDRCRRPPWQHDHMVAAAPGTLTLRPWPATVLHDWITRGVITPARAHHLQDTQPTGYRPATPTTTQ